MRVFRYLALALCMATAVLARGQNQDWLPITQQDLQFKDVPGNPGATAARLYYAHFIDDNTSTEFYYERIKILNEKALNPNEEGKTYADVEIPIGSIAANQLGLVISVIDLKARTIHPDGSIVEFSGKPYEKTRYKGHGSKLAVKAFSMPSVTVGSIVEYKYTLSYKSPVDFFGIFFAPGEWVMQSELYTVKEHLHYRPYEGGAFQSMSKSSMYWDGAQVARVAFNLKEKPKYQGNESD